MAPFLSVRTRATALPARVLSRAGLLFLLTLLLALAAAPAEAREHGRKAAREAASGVVAPAAAAQAPAVTARAVAPPLPPVQAPAPSALPGPDPSGQPPAPVPGPEQPGNGPGTPADPGQGVPGNDGEGSGSNPDEGSNGEPDDGEQPPAEPGDGDGGEEQPTTPTAEIPGVGTDSTSGTSTDRPAETPALPLVPTAVAPVATPQPRDTNQNERGSGGGNGNGGSGRGSNGGRTATPAGGSGGGATGVAGASGAGAATPAAPTGGAAAGDNGGSGQSAGGDQKGGGSDEGSPVTRTVTRTVKDIVEVVPESAKMTLAALAALAVLLGFGYLLTALRARRLGRQRQELLQEVGLLQGALLPAVPSAIGSLRTSVAYRPAEGPGAGGDFYDVLPLSGGRVGFILGDVSGHGHAALERTAFMRYTLRAYLEAGLEPRVALQVAGRVIDDSLGGDFATVLLAVHDPSSGSLTYASAGHPGPIVVGNDSHEPLTVASSPPIGVGVRTGLRQTTLPLRTGSLACLFTDGLIEARTEEGVLGRKRLHQIVAELGPDAEAGQLLDRVAAEARANSDDMATCLIAPSAGATAGGFQTEQLELNARELEAPLAARFLAACQVSDEDAVQAIDDAKRVAARFGGVVLHVVLGNRRSVEVLPRNVESIEAASRRAAAVG